MVQLKNLQQAAFTGKPEKYALAEHTLKLTVRETRQMPPHRLMLVLRPKNVFGVLVINNPLNRDYGPMPLVHQAVIKQHIRP